MREARAAQTRPVRDVQSAAGEECTASKLKSGLTKAQNDIAGGYLNAWNALDGCCTLLALSLWG